MHDTQIHIQTDTQTDKHAYTPTRTVALKRQKKKEFELLFNRRLFCSRQQLTAGRRHAREVLFSKYTGMFVRFIAKYKVFTFAMMWSNLPSNET